MVPKDPNPASDLESIVTTQVLPQIPEDSPKWSKGSYGRMAGFMNEFPELTIVRRFGQLNIETILAMQAEISHLEERLHDLRTEQEAQNDEKGLMAQRSWFELSGLDDSEQWSLMKEVHEKLREYIRPYHISPSEDNLRTDEFIFYYKQSCTLHNPSRNSLHRLREYLVRPRCGDNFLRGIEREIYHKSEQAEVDRQRTSDLVTLGPEELERDYFSRWLSEQVLDKYHSLIGRRLKRPIDGEGDIYLYRNDHLRAATHLAGIILASVIPAASVFTLYYVKPQLDRLFVLLGYSVLFSVCLATFTNARRAEIFAGTAAFASVQVVFVGSTTH